MRVDALAALFADIARGEYPRQDGLTVPVASPLGAIAGVFSFTAHNVVAADVDPGWVASLCAPWDLAAPLSAEFLCRLADRVRARPGVLDVLLLAPGASGRASLSLVEVDPHHDHRRVARAHRYRKDVRVYRTAGGEGLVTVGRGVAGRWEAGFEVEPAARGRGLGRALAAAARHLIDPGAGLFMQVAPGNSASLHAVLAAQFQPIGAEVLFMRAYHDADAGFAPSVDP